VTKHIMTVELDLPEDLLSLDDARTVARKMGLTFDEWVSRCLVEHTHNTLRRLEDPEQNAFFDARPPGGYPKTGLDDLRRVADETDSEGV